jgi:hypothetical protein
VLSGRTCGVRVEKNRLGFTGLAALDTAGKKYWLLLHDTCDADEDLKGKLESLDVGLDPDAILFEAMGDVLEIGLYRSQFVEATKDVMKDKPGRILQQMRESATVSVVLDVSAKDEGDKDVYGGGITRSVISMPKVGIKKFQGRRASGGRP